MADKWADERKSLTAKVISTEGIFKKKFYLPTVFIGADHIHEHFSIQVRESIEAVNRDKECRSEDALNFQKKYQYLTKFRDDNKKVS